MASYNELNALIDAYINRNGVQAITGQILNGVLKAMVEQLGRGYTIMGAATPATDPGTPDGPECYFASETGTYTDFDGLQVAPGELALLCYTPSDGWTKATIYEGFQEVGATIDENVGTPSVGVSYANGVLSFDFHNMKGNPGQNGQDGQDGAAAGFGTIGADITGGVGTPGVSVESSGPATAKNLQFHFTNLKGETGVTSVVATVDNTTGTPACTVSLVGQQLTLAFSGLKGAQGNTGSSVDYPFTIVNNLTTDDATQALSAAQGVVLQGEITQLEAKVDDINLTSDVSAIGDDSLSFVDENDNCIAQFKGGHIKTKEFDSRDAATQTYVNTQINAATENVPLTDNEDENDAALAFVDENDECILQAKDGHIKTKNFDSRAALIPDNVDEDDAAFAIVDEDSECIVQFKEGHIKTKNFDSRNLETKSTKFAGLGMDSLAVLGTSSKSGNVINIASGVNNRVQVPADLQAWYYKILCTVKCTSGTAGITIGKNGYYGTLFTVSGSSLVVKLNGNNQEAVSIGFSIELNRIYTVTVSHNVSTTKADTFEIYDDFGNYFSYTTPYTAHSYGNPVVYSDTATLEMTKFAMSMQERYNPNITKMIVTGHSYVEADSLGSSRESCFTALLDDYNGQNSVVNCGLGGDSVSAMNTKMPYFLKMCPNTEYVLMCIGGNDKLETADTIIAGLETALSIVEGTNKKPVLFTINPEKTGYGNVAFPTVNTWIRQSGYPYVDMDKVFYNADGTINQTLYLNDGLHPTVEGHLRIFRRIQMDCPFLF